MYKNQKYYVSWAGLEIKRNRVHIVTDRRGRSTGEAYVQFVTKDESENALKRNREKIGHRYIEIFRSTWGEMKRQVGNRPVGPYDKKDRGSSRGDREFGGRGSREIWATNGSGNNIGSCHFGNNGGGRFSAGNNSGSGSNFGDFGAFGNNRGGNNPFNTSISFDSPFNSTRNSGGGTGSNFGNSIFGSGANNSGNMNDGMRANNMGSNAGFGPVGSNRNEDLFCVHMRGLPYFCFENDVFRFFEPLRPINVKIIYNNKGLHSGTADAFFDSREEAVQAMKKHREQMGNRYIELFFDGQTNKGNYSRRI